MGNGQLPIFRDEATTAYIAVSVMCRKSSPPIKSNVGISKVGWLRIFAQVVANESLVINRGVVG